MDYDKLYRMGMMALVAIAALTFAGLGMLDMRTAFEIASGAASLSMPSLIGVGGGGRSTSHV